MWEWINLGKVGGPMGGDQYAFITALAAAIAVIVHSVRKRKDVDIIEVLKQNASLVKRVEVLESTVAVLQTELVQAEHDRFTLRRVLAGHGISDPTTEARRYGDSTDEA